MIFYEKISFLMQLTSTSNKKLAEALNVDPSLISLLRTGCREAPKNTNYIQTMSHYFAKRCEGNESRLALSQVLTNKQLPMSLNTEQLSAILFDWLTDKRDSVAHFLNTFEKYSVNTPEFSATETETHNNRTGTYVYYGNAGKRQAFRVFLKHLLSLNTPSVLYMSEDSNYEWLHEDEIYLKAVQKQLILLLGMGYKIQRISEPIYSVDQAFFSLTKWLPLYMTGNVQSYYYPRVRDNVYHRTIMAVPDVGAIASTSVGNHEDNRIVLLTYNANIANCYAEDIKDYLKLCRPMTNSFQMDGENKALLNSLVAFENDKGHRIQQSASLSAITTPGSVIKEITAGINSEKLYTTSVLLSAQKTFLQSLDEYEAIDIHCIATPQAVKNGKVPIAAAYLINGEKRFYSVSGYIQHLKNILLFAEKYKNYCPVIINDENDETALLVKENRQVLLPRIKEPVSMLEISQPYIAEACREFLLRKFTLPFNAQKLRDECKNLICSKIAEFEKLLNNTN